jgi:hypothetical protein
MFLPLKFGYTDAQGNEVDLFEETFGKEAYEYALSLAPTSSSIMPSWFSYLAPTVEPEVDYEAIFAQSNQKF